MKKNSILSLLGFTILIPIVMPSKLRLVEAEETTSENAPAIKVMAEIMETNRTLHRYGLTLIGNWTWPQSRNYATISEMR